MRVTAFLLGGIFVATLAPGNCIEPACRFRVESKLVMIPLSVTDRAGHAVPGLDKNDFTVAEDGSPQPVWAVSRWDAPVSIGVVFDTSGSMAGDIRVAQSALADLFHESNPEDEAFLIQFAGAPRLETGFVHDPDQISRKLLSCPPRGATALFDAIHAGLDQMVHASNQHKALFVFTDGGDNHSRLSFAELLSTARERDVQIFVLTIRRNARELDEQRGRVQLDQLANDTGGRLLIVNRDDETRRAIADIAESIRNQYLLFYRPLNALQDGKWRRVRVRLRVQSRKSSYRINSRDGYYSPEPLSGSASIQ